MRTSGLVFVAIVYGAPLSGALAQEAGEPPPPPPAETPAAAPAAAVPAMPSKTEEGAAQLVRGNAGQAIADYTEALKDTGLANDRRATILNDRAVAYARLGQNKLAIEDFNRAVQLFAEYPAAYNNRGNLLVIIGQYAEAIKDFDRAILLAPRYAAAYSNRANARVKLGQQGDAIRDFTKAIELMPASAPPLSGRGLALLASGKPHAAIRDFSRAVNADARFASAYRNRAEARFGVGQYDDSIEDLSRAIAFDSNNPEIYVVRGYAYLASSNTASAIKDFARAVELDPKSVAAYQGRGLANGLAEATDDAFADLNKAIELDPRSAVAFAYRAYVYKQTSQPDVGQKDVETALKLAPACPEAHWARGEIAEARGQADAAVADYRKALTYKPSWRLADEGLKRLGAANEAADERELPGLGRDSWKVVARGTAFFAISDDYPNLRVPLEMMGTGEPRIINWEVREPPFKGYGVLRFSGGQVSGPSGAEDTELAAIIDIDNAKIVSIQPNKQGAKVATWTWDEGRVQVASIDGVTDEFVLRSTSVPGEDGGAGLAAGAAVGAGAAATRRYSQGAPKSSKWAPWNNPIGMPQSGRRDPPRQQASKKSHSKPKTLFDLLFN
jgi:tetratricopeptide (TPR) repeat protein